MEPVTTAALLGAGVSGAIGLGTQAYNWYQQRKSNEANVNEQRRVNKEAYDQSIENRQYNSPKALMARLKEAGLNPQLALSQPMNQMAQLPQYQAGKTRPHQASGIDFNAGLNAFGKMVDINQSIQGVKNLKTQNDLMLSQKQYYEALKLSTLADIPVKGKQVGKITAETGQIDHNVKYAGKTSTTDNSELGTLIRYGGRLLSWLYATGKNLSSDVNPYVKAGVKSGVKSVSKVWDKSKKGNWHYK